MADKRIALNTKNRKLMIHESVTSYLFLLPFMLFFVGFVLYERRYYSNYYVSK